MRPHRILPAPLAAFLALAPTTPSLRAALDFDHDGVSDIWSSAHPAAGAPSADPDGDGFSNLAEATAGTDPFSAASRPTSTVQRTTGGELVLRWPGLRFKRYTVQSSPDLKTWTPLAGISTGADSELVKTVLAAGATTPERQFWRISFLETDSDNDGLSDWEEDALGTSPTTKDTDGDGLPDLWEAMHGSSPLSADASADPDHDGFSNAREYAAGTDPNYRSLPVAGGPVVFWVSQPVAPDETMLVTCGGTDLDSSAELAALPNSDPDSPLATAPPPTGWAAVAPHSATPRSLTVTVPAAWARGIYALRLKESGATGPVRLVNAPDPWFVEGDLGETATPGGSLTVAGTCLEILGGSGPRLALVRSGAVVATLTTPERVTTSTGYALRYSVPADINTGDYTLYVHNGCGGPAGWVKFSTFIAAPVETVRIAAPIAWPTTEYPVAAPTGTDDDSKIAAALAQAARNGGGIVRLATGTYALTTRLILPSQTVLAGAGRAATTIRWSVVPPAVAPFATANPLVTGSPVYPNSSSTLTTFAIEDISLESSADFTGNLVFRMGTREPGWIKRASLRIPTPPGSGGSPAAIYLRQTANTLLDDLVLEGPIYCLYGRDSITHLRLTNSRLNWRGMSVWLGSGSHNLLLTGNTLNLLGNPTTNRWTTLANPNPGFFFTCFYGNRYSRDLLWAGNRSTREDTTFTMPGYVGFSGDGSSGGYRGGITGASGTALTLTATVGSYSPPAGQPADWAGAIVQILDGRGAGQWRYTVSAIPSSSTINVDRPWDVTPDSTSTLALNDLLGRVLMIDNDYAQEPLNQDYFLSLDSIKAGNHFGVDGASSAFVTWTGRHYQGTQPGWHLQVLDNQIVRGAQTAFQSGVVLADVGYTGTVGAAHVYRHNTNSSGQPCNFLLRTVSGPFADALVEHNEFTSIKLAGQGDQPLAVSGILLRGNTLPGGPATPVTPASPTPGITSK